MERESGEAAGGKQLGANAIAVIGHPRVRLTEKTEHSY